MRKFPDPIVLSSGRNGRFGTPPAPSPITSSAELGRLVHKVPELVLRRVCGQEPCIEPARHVVHFRVRAPDLRMLGPAAALEAQLAVRFRQCLQRRPVLQAQRQRDRQRIHQPADGRTLLLHLDDDYIRLTISPGVPFSHRPADRHPSASTESWSTKHKSCTCGSAFTLNSAELAQSRLQPSWEAAGPLLERDLTDSQSVGT